MAIMQHSCKERWKGLPVCYHRRKLSCFGAKLPGALNVLRRRHMPGCKCLLMKVLRTYEAIKTCYHEAQVCSPQEWAHSAHPD